MVHVAVGPVQVHVLHHGLEPVLLYLPAVEQDDHLQGREAAGLAAVEVVERGNLYLEPGEVESVMSALRDAAARGSDMHPRSLMLAAVSNALAERISGVGLVIAAAPLPVVRDAAEAYIRHRARRVVRLPARPALRGA